MAAVTRVGLVMQVLARVTVANSDFVMVPGVEVKHLGFPVIYPDHCVRTSGQGFLPLGSPALEDRLS